MQYLYRPSDADIKAKVLYSYRDVIDGTWVEMAPTGNTKERYSKMCIRDRRGAVLQRTRM